MNSIYIINFIAQISGSLESAFQIIILYALASRKSLYHITGVPLYTVRDRSSEDS